MSRMSRDRDGVPATIIRISTQSLTRLRLACGMLRMLEISNARRVVAPAEEAYGLRPVSEYTRSVLSSDAIGAIVCP